MDIDSKIRKIPNWPKPGILFYDVTTLFEDREAFRYVIDELSRPYQFMQVDKIVGIDARGFLLASSMAYKLNAGVSIVRKKGKLPYKCRQATYEKEYGPDTIEIHEDTIKPGERVIIVDDLIATGGTMKATCELVEQLGGVIVGISWIVDLPFLSGSEKIQRYDCHYLIKYDSDTTSNSLESGSNISNDDEQKFPEPVVGVMVLNDKDEMLLVKSPKWNGEYSIVGGHVELGESMEEAIKREVKEETNLDINDIKFLHHQDCIYPDTFYKKRHFIFLDYVCRTNNPDVLRLDGREGIDYVWVKPEGALTRSDLGPYGRNTIEHYLRDKKIMDNRTIEQSNNRTIKVGIIGGSGLENLDILQDKQEEKVNTPYGRTSDILTVGKIAGVDVVIIPRHGRGHTIKPTDVNYQANIWAMKELGVTHILAPTACGSLKEEIRPGDFVILDQFIDRTTKREQTFYEGRVCHIGMAEPFCSKLREIIYRNCLDLGLSAHEKGTIVTIEGPRFSTRAESNLFRFWGGDVVNMTTVPEVVLAREAGICYANIAVVTDYDCWREGGEAVTMEMILRTMKENDENVKRLLTEVIPKIQYTECECQEAIKTAIV